MRLDREKIEAIMGRQIGRARWTAREFCVPRGVSEPWLSNTLGLATLGHDFRQDRAERMAEILGVPLSDIQADKVLVQTEA